MSKQAHQHIRALLDKQGELYVSIKDLREFVKEDALELLSYGERDTDHQIFSLLDFTLNEIESWYKPIS